MAAESEDMFLTNEDGSPNWSMNESLGNPFEIEDGCNLSPAGEEEFCSAEAAEKILAEDDQFHRKVDFEEEQSVRWANETFMNMTIGAYMAAGSEDVDKFAVNNASTVKILSPPLRKSPESSPWLHLSTEESLPHSLPQPLENTVANASSSLEETLPNSPPVSLVSMNDPQMSSTVPVLLPDLEESSSSYDFTLSEMHRVIGSGEMTCSNVTMLLGHVQKQKEAKKAAALEKHSAATPNDLAPKNVSMNNKQDHSPHSKSERAVNSLLPELSPPLPPQHVFKKPEVPVKNLTDNQNTLAVQQTNGNSPTEVHSEPVKETRSSFAAIPPGYINSVEEMFPHHLMSDTQSSMEMSSRDESKMVSLLPETTAMSFLQDSIQTRDFVASTPLVGQKKGPTWFSGATPLDQHSIHYLLTPYKQSQVISVPERVDIPDVCCVMLGQQTQFPVVNKIKRGVKCTFTVRKASLDGKSIEFDKCPFEIKSQITLQPESEEQVKVLFTPKDQGQFWASLEVFAQNLTNPSECRTYTLVLHGKAEYPLLQVSPKNELLDFGDVIWGNYEYRSFRIQNVGKATVPIRFSIFRTESSLCNFSFCTEQSCDLSSISFTPKPEGACSVLSMSLPGLKDGEKVQTHTVKVCCHVKDVQNADKKYSEKSDKFQAVLHIDLDVPMSSHSHLSQMRIIVTAGMVKLHTDKDRMDLSTLPGDIKKGFVKVINSGNIPMNLSLHMEPQIPCFSLNTSQMILGPQVDKMVEIEYKPLYSSSTNDEADLILFDQLNEYRIPVVGQTKTVKSKISASATCISFGGVDVGKRKTQKFTIVPDNDCKLKIGIKDGNGVFQIFNEDHCLEELTVVSVQRKVKYTVMVSFQPMEVQFYSQLLTVQVFNADRFTIPIFGYGGQSHIEVTGVNQTESGEQFIDLGQIAQGSSEVRRLLVTNHGVRNAYLKATAYDVSRKELAPHRATIMPSRLLLEPNESKELILMLNPSEAETKLCISGRALVALVKLLHGDEITRQILLKSETAQAKTYALDFDIALTARDRENVDSEAISSVPCGQEVNLFKKSMSSIKLGLLAQTLTPEKLPQSLPSPVTTNSSAGRRKNFSPSTRSALQPVNQNIHGSDVDRSSWSVNPADIQMTVFDARSKEFAQIINFSNKELRFTIECDDILKVVPSEGVVKSKNLLQFGIHPGDNYWNKGENPSCGLIKITCAQQTQYIRVIIIPVPERLASPVAFSHKLPQGVHFDPAISEDNATVSSQEEYNFPSTKLASSTSSLPSNPSSTHAVNPARSRSLASAEIKASAPPFIQASSEVIVPPVSPGNVREMKYVFTNASCQALSWAVRSCELPNVKISGDSDTLCVHQSVFNLSPTSGSLKPDEVQSLKLEFIPPSVGFYSQGWMISFSPNERVHYFTVYGKGCEVSQQVSESRQPSPSRCVDHEKPYKETKQLPEWVPVASNADDKRNEKSSEASHKKAAPPRTSLKGGNESGKEVSLDKTHLHFGQVRRGDKQTKEIHVSNPMNRDAEIIVEQEPGPPYTTRRSHFKIGKSRMIIYPITFKPVKLGKSVARIAMREKHCGNVLMATLEGECIP